MNTPYKRDIIGMLPDACHKRGVPLCLYYSIADWNSPYPNQGRPHELAPRSPATARLGRNTSNSSRPRSASLHQLRRASRLLVGHERARACGSVHQRHDPALQPKAVINNRGFDEGDFGTPERDYDSGAAEAARLRGAPRRARAVGMESWGYRKDKDYYTDRHLIRSLPATSPVTRTTC